jgi:hypothetical protein
MWCLESICRFFEYLLNIGSNSIQHYLKLKICPNYYSQTSILCSWTCTYIKHAMWSKKQKVIVSCHVKFVNKSRGPPTPPIETWRPQTLKPHMFNVYCFPMPSINMKKNWSLFIRWGTIEILPLGGFDLCKCRGTKLTLSPQNMAAFARKKKKHYCILNHWNTIIFACKHFTIFHFIVKL